jgi:hypothetical protein
MTVHFIDPPGPMTNTSEPIDFTVTYPVTSISIEFNPHIGNGARDTVWDGVADDNSGGDFSYKYRKSTKSLDGLTWHIVPFDRWPAEFRIRVKEAAPASQGGLALAPIYTVDFTQLPTDSFGTAGAYVIDSKTWYAKAPVAGPFGSNVSSGILNGSGLYLAQSNGATGNHFDDGVVTLPYRHMFFPLANLPATYNPDAPLLIRWHMDGGHVGSNDNCPVGGLVQGGNDGTGILSTDRIYDDVIRPYAGINASTAKRGNTTGNDVDNGAGISYWTREWGLYRPLKGPAEVWAATSGSWSGEFGDVNLMHLGIGVGNVPFAPARANPGFIFAIDGQVSTQSVYLTHLQFLQPRNP